jgi:surface protein
MILPLQNPVGVTIDWGDGNTNSSLVHIYTSSYSTLTIQVLTGTFTQFGTGGIDPFNPLTDWNGTNILDLGYNVLLNGAYYLTSVDITYLPSSCSSLNCAFVNARNLLTSTGSITNNVTNLASMFRGAFLFNSDLSGWDVSNVVSMNGMFASAVKFNSDLSGWDVSNVEDMASMFSGGAPGEMLFTSDLSQWKVDNVLNMSYMFSQANNFNSDLSQWNVSKVTDMAGMFSARANDPMIFTSDLSGWDVSNVTDMNSMFYGASSFQSDLPWNVSKVTNMSEMFSGATLFNADISNWDVSSVEDMSLMFSGNVSDTVFNQNISSWDVSNVTSMSNMFSKSIFNQDLLWNVSNVVNMLGMFQLNSAFNGDISNWDVSKVTDMTYMFSSAFAFNQNLSTWNIENVTDMTGMFDKTGMSKTNFSNTLIGWSTQNVIYGVHIGDKGMKVNLSGYNAYKRLKNVYGWVFQPPPLSPLPICYREGTKLLVLGNNGADEYQKIECLKKGDLVKTWKDGYRKIKFIFQGIMKNKPETWQECMYVLQSGSEKEEDLYITGQHSILIPECKVSKEYKELFQSANIKIPKLGGYCMVNAGLSRLFEKVTDETYMNIFHVVLENDGKNDKQYGIWANGVLSESLSERSYRERNFIGEKMKSLKENKKKECEMFRWKMSHGEFNSSVKNRKNVSFRFG